MTRGEKLAEITQRYVCAREAVIWKRVRDQQNFYAVRVGMIPTNDWTYGRFGSWFSDYADKNSIFIDKIVLDYL